MRDYAKWVIIAHGLGTAGVVFWCLRCLMHKRQSVALPFEMFPECNPGFRIFWRRSAVLERRLALLGEGGHAFFLVFQGEGGMEDAAFEEQAFVE